MHASCSLGNVPSSCSGSECQSQPHANPHYTALGVLMRALPCQPRPQLFCAGTTALPAVNASELLPSATEQWTAVLAASTLMPPAAHTENRPETQQEIPSEVAATKATDITHSQTTTSGVENAHPHHATHQHGTPQAVRQRGTLAFDKQSAGDSSFAAAAVTLLGFAGTTRFIPLCMSCSVPSFGMQPAEAVFCLQGNTTLAL